MASNGTFIEGPGRKQLRALLRKFHMLRALSSPAQSRLQEFQSAPLLELGKKKKRVKLNPFVCIRSSFTIGKRPLQSFQQERRHYFRHGLGGTQRLFRKGIIIVGQSREYFIRVIVCSSSVISGSPYIRLNFIIADEYLSRNNEHGIMRYPFEATHVP